MDFYYKHRPDYVRATIARAENEELSFVVAEVQRLTAGTKHHSDLYAQVARTWAARALLEVRRHYAARKLALAYALRNDVRRAATYQQALTAERKAVHHLNYCACCCATV